MLTDREKFIAHYVSVSILVALDKKPEGAVRKVIDKLHNGRTKNLKDHMMLFFTGMRKNTSSSTKLLNQNIYF